MYGFRRGGTKGSLGDFDTCLLNLSSHFYTLRRRLSSLSATGLHRVRCVSITVDVFGGFAHVYIYIYIYIYIYMYAPKEILIPCVKRKDSKECDSVARSIPVFLAPARQPPSSLVLLPWPMVHEKYYEPVFVSAFYCLVLLVMTFLRNVEFLCPNQPLPEWPFAQRLDNSSFWDFRIGVL